MSVDQMTGKALRPQGVSNNSAAVTSGTTQAGVMGTGTQPANAAAPQGVPQQPTGKAPAGSIPGQYQGQQTYKSAPPMAASTAQFANATTAALGAAPGMQQGFMPPGPPPQKKPPPPPPPPQGQGFVPPQSQPPAPPPPSGMQGFVPQGYQASPGMPPPPPPPQQQQPWNLPQGFAGNVPGMPQAAPQTPGLAKLLYGNMAGAPTPQNAAFDAQNAFWQGDASNQGYAQSPPQQAAQGGFTAHPYAPVSKFPQPAPQGQGGQQQGAAFPPPPPQGQGQAWDWQQKWANQGAGDPGGVGMYAAGNQGAATDPTQWDYSDFPKTWNPYGPTGNIAKMGADIASTQTAAQGLPDFKTYAEQQLGKSAAEDQTAGYWNQGAEGLGSAIAKLNQLDPASLANTQYDKQMYDIQSGLDETRAAGALSAAQGGRTGGGGAAVALARAQLDAVGQRLAAEQAKQQTLLEGTLGVTAGLTNAGGQAGKLGLQAGDIQNQWMLNKSAQQEAQRTAAQDQYMSQAASLQAMQESDVNPAILQQIAAQLGISWNPYTQGVAMGYGMFQPGNAAPGAAQSAWAKAATDEQKMKEGASKAASIL